MESEKVKEIKKALECCAKKNRLPCTTCIKSEETDVVLTCRSLLEDILTLINELEKCSEKWQELCANEVALNKTLRDKINELESENERLVKQLEDMPIPFMGCMLENQLLSDISKEKNGEIKALKDRIYELENGIAKSMLGCEFLPECTNEKLKQFAEMLKEITCEMYLKEQLHRCIDETLNKFLKGETNE